MKKALYKEVIRNLHNEQLYEKKDKHLLLDCLPYPLKNKLIEEMYKSIIQNFIFFKDIDNSDFIAKIVTSLKPLITIKNDVVIQEGEFIKEIIFVKKGIIELNISIDINSPEYSIKKLYGKNQIGKYNISYIKISEIRNNDSNYLQYNNLYPFSSKVYQNEDSSNKSDDNIEYINILVIRQNEHFGNALMFLNEKCPLNGKIKSKKAELLTLRKLDAIEIYSIYPHIWKKINKKSLFNLEQIYKKIEKVVIDISTRYNIQLENNNNNNNYQSNNLINNGIQKNIKINKEKTKNIKQNKKQNKNKNKESQSLNNIKDNEGFKNKLEEIKEKLSKEDINQIEKLPEKINFTKTLNSNHHTLSQKSLKKRESNKSFSNKDKDKDRIKGNNLLTKLKLIKKIKTVKNNNNYFLNTSISNTNIFNNSSEIDLLDKSYIINDEIKDGESFIGRNSITIKNSNTKIKAFIIPNLIISSNNLSFIKEKLSPKTLIANNNKFVNLNSTKENSFQLNSSYENINKISNNKYIKDISLQNKIKQIIKEDCTKNICLASCINNDILNNNLSPVFSPKQKMSKCGPTKINLFSHIKEDIKKNETQPIKSNNYIRKNNSKKLFKDLKSENSQSDDDNIFSNKNNIMSSFKRSSLHRIYNICSPTRLKRKPNKRKSQVELKLNTISKNIENANNAINNPYEFYMNLFSSIIKKKIKIDKENKNYEEDEEDEEDKDKEDEEDKKDGKEIVEKIKKSFISIFNSNLSYKNN